MTLALLEHTVGQDRLCEGRMEGTRERIMGAI